MKENASAGDIRLSPSDLEKITAVLEKEPLKGEAER